MLSGIRTLKFTDFLLALPVVLVVFALLLETTCGGWSEAPSNGSCSLPLLTPVYAVVMNIAFGLAFSAILWGPFYVALYLGSTFEKVRRLRAGTLREEPVGIWIWTAATLMILFLLYVLLGLPLP